MVIFLHFFGFFPLFHFHISFLISFEKEKEKEKKEHNVYRHCRLASISFLRNTTEKSFQRKRKNIKWNENKKKHQLCVRVCSFISMRILARCIFIFVRFRSSYSSSSFASYAKLCLSAFIVLCRCIHVCVCACTILSFNTLPKDQKVNQKH